jgi:hypothetical protein
MKCRYWIPKGQREFWYELRMICGKVGPLALPNALNRKYPNAGKEWGWQWVFPATSHYNDRIGEKRRQSSSRIRFTESCETSRAQIGNIRTGQFAHVSPLFRDTPSGRWLRYQDCPGTFGP